ncbi:hypothetical protein AN958_00073 [Leucoagaricus sp. SymC.cos]|nr:hypothetical protein AN958_00073 [Leucoagaricus sp. SymC.cos]
MGKGVKVVGVIGGLIIGSVTVDPGAEVAGKDVTLNVTDDTETELSDEVADTTDEVADTTDEDGTAIDVDALEETVEPVECGAEPEEGKLEVTTPDDVAWPEKLEVAARATGRSESQRDLIVAFKKRKMR